MMQTKVHTQFVPLPRGGIHLELYNKETGRGMEIWVGTGHDGFMCSTVRGAEDGPCGHLIYSTFEEAEAACRALRAALAWLKAQEVKNA
jgi:hypothetical protein